MQTQITCQRDAEGYLVHPEEWDADIAAELAAEENIELAERHWPILEFVRGYWEEHKIIPDIRHVASHMAQAQNIDKKTAKQQLFQLFPYGYVKQTCKIAGMQRPRAWSTG
ncbi:TusE/DsrC/DsvC family sulfur relay protein [Candidatus Thiothrix sp. Deng01]|uniref:Sulfurtransferase n=1 Tax=Candidatus Thiothrix phosphatis TaxID=3112415 RepID=A0ABU6CVB7_9GAMM|nr:TusE/DsrC/DsvC family sulfur relay protein [Candidatus Thiothrix sp. Deng01]MEB4590477.1 TusE/DsrC/DsvC family sulfur relay protein [Candidatus Thiothrix sp. Deng01]